VSSVKARRLIWVPIIHTSADLGSLQSAVRRIHEQRGGTSVSSDEMTGLQALERNAPSRPMTSGHCEKIEFEYTRHGTLRFIGNFQVTTGELIAPTIGPTRTEADFASHIEQTVATDPKASWIFVVDNWNIHCSETLVRKVAQACGIEQPLGKKGVRGVLKSVASLQAFTCRPLRAKPAA
jgi:hypothetical protein